MERRSGGGKWAPWRADFQQKYLSRLLSLLRRRKIDQRSTRLSARIRAVKLAADLSLAMTVRSRTAWRRAILGKYHFRFNKSGCQRRRVKSRRNPRGTRRSVSGKGRPCATAVACDNAYKQLPGEEYGLMGTTGIWSCDNCNEEAMGTVDSRMETLRALVPGSSRLDTPVFLKEAADYIVALEMQVQAMRALADLWSNSNAQASCHDKI